MPSSDPLVIVRYLDVLAGVLAAPFVLLMGGPMLGYASAAPTWIATRIGRRGARALGRGRRDTRASRSASVSRVLLGSARGAWGLPSSRSASPATARTA